MSRLVLYIVSVGYSLGFCCCECISLEIFWFDVRGGLNLFYFFYLVVFWG